MRKGRFIWFMNLSEEHKLQVFKRWRMISTDIRKHWCLNDVVIDKKLVNIMLKEVRTNIVGEEDLTRLNDLDSSFRNIYHL
jgi:hypothetical protein